MNEIMQLNEVMRRVGDEVREVTRVSGHGRSWRLPPGLGPQDQGPRTASGPSLAMQWLRLRASTTGALGSEMGSQWEFSTEARQGLANTPKKNRAVGQGCGGKRSFIHGGDDGDKVAEFSGQYRGGNHGVCGLMGLWGRGE